MKWIKIFLMILTISALLIIPTEGGSWEDPSQGQVEPLGEPLGETSSYEDYIEIVGDGHMHSNHKGGASSVHEMALKAQERGLDWIFITDYDTVAAKNNCTEETNETFICGLGEEVQVLEGGEYTNEIIAWGIDTVVDGHANENHTVGDIIDEIHRQGGLAYLPHPCAPGLDDNYDYFGVYDDFDGLSIYHGYAGFNDDPIIPQLKMDGNALRKWDEYLTNGFRKTALGESDCKNAEYTPDYGDVNTRRGAIGYPRNYIYTKEFSVRGIIEAVRQGRCYLTDGPTMNFTIDGYIMGDTIYSDTSKSLNIQITGNAIEDTTTVKIVSNGGEIYSQDVSAGPFTVSHSYFASSDAYFRVEIRTGNGIFMTKGETNISFSNPIYFDLSPYEEPPSPPSNLEAWINGSDVVLNWTASSSNDVMHYNIYKSTTSNEFDFTYPYALTNGTTWIDEGAGDGDPNDYFYIVRAVDMKLYNDTNRIKVGKYVTSLHEKWNLVSTPLILSKTDPTEVLQTVENSCQIAFYFDASDSIDPWKDTRTGDLIQINNTMALWLHLNASDNFITAGKLPTSTNISLYKGWNLIGYPSFSNSSLDDVLEGLNWKEARFYDRWDAKGDYWKQNNTEKSAHMNDLYEMRTGNGYWLYVVENCTWTV